VVLEYLDDFIYMKAEVEEDYIKSKRKYDEAIEKR
jgi:hypothetical protein